MSARYRSIERNGDTCEENISSLTLPIDDVYIPPIHSEFISLAGE